MPHEYNFAEFRLAIFKNVDILGQFLSVPVLIFVLKIDVLIRIYIIQNCTNFGKTRQYLSHKNLRLSYLPHLQFLTYSLFNLLVINLLRLVFLLQLPGLQVDLSVRRVIQFQFSLMKCSSHLRQDGLLDGQNQVIHDNICIQELGAFVNKIIDCIFIQFNLSIGLIKRMISAFEYLWGIKLVLQTIIVETFKLFGTNIVT